MGNMIKARVEIVGNRPMLFHRFGEDALPLDGRKEREGVAGNDPSAPVRN